MVKSTRKGNYKNESKSDEVSEMAINRNKKLIHHVRELLERESD
jgi:hypothetical protein